MLRPWKRFWQEAVKWFIIRAKSRQSLQSTCCSAPWLLSYNCTTIWKQEGDFSIQNMQLSKTNIHSILCRRDLWLGEALTFALICPRMLSCTHPWPQGSILYPPPSSSALTWISPLPLLPWRRGGIRSVCTDHHPLPARPSVLPPAFALEMLEPNLSLSDNFSELCQILIISRWQMHCSFYWVHITGCICIR